jgi:hypothetical protein
MDGEGVKRWCTETSADKILSRSETAVEEKKKRWWPGRLSLGIASHRSVSPFILLLGPALLIHKGNILKANGL